MKMNHHQKGLCKLNIVAPYAHGFCCQSSTPAKSLITWQHIYCTTPLFEATIIHVDFVVGGVTWNIVLFGFVRSKVKQTSGPLILKTQSARTAMSSTSISHHTQSHPLPPHQPTFLSIVHYANQAHQLSGSITYACTSSMHMRM